MQSVDSVFDSEFKSFFFLSCLLRVIGTFHIRIEQLELKCMSSGKLCSYIYRRI